MVKYAKFSAVAAFAAVLAMFGIALSASATHVDPTVLTGNPSSCDSKIEPVESGTYDGVTITVDGKYFDFTTAPGVVVTDIVVKGGPDANWYHYDPAETSDTGLHAPINPKNGQPYGLSHLCITSDKKTPPPSTSTSPTPDPKP